jgi:hypothetical protein
MDLHEDDVEEIDDAPGLGEGEETSKKKPNGSQEEGRQPKQADILIALANKCTLFHTPAPDADAYVDLEIDGHRETCRVRSAAFRGWLRQRFYKATGGGCNSDALLTAVETIAARAMYEKGHVEQAVHTRIAGYGEAIYIDLGDPQWRAIEVTKDGWKVVDKPPVRFHRTSTLCALPEPERNGDINLLKDFCNVKTEDEFVLLIAFMLGALRPGTNYPVLAVAGEQGTCKTSLLRCIAALTDPREPKERSLPRDEDNLITAAKYQHVLSFDNVSGIPDWLSDALCRLSTGGGVGKRKLYTDDEESLFSGRRPIMLNGVEEVVRRPDLVERVIMLVLGVIPEAQRREEEEMLADFAAKAPKIFGALLDGLVAGLRNLPTVQIKDKPRMADFARWAEAGTRAYWEPDTFLTAYRNNVSGAVEMVVDASPLADAIRQLMATTTRWEGTAADLLGALEAIADEHVKRSKEWPATSKALGRRIVRVAAPLRKLGIHIDWGRTAAARRIIITKISPSPEPPERVGKETSEMAETSFLKDSNGKADDMLNDINDMSKQLSDQTSSGKPLKDNGNDMNDITDVFLPTQTDDDGWIDWPPEADAAERVGKETSQTSLTSSTKDSNGKADDVSGCLPHVCDSETSLTPKVPVEQDRWFEVEI